MKKSIAALSKILLGPGKGQFFIISSAIIMILVFSAISFLQGYNEINFQDQSYVQELLFFNAISNNIEKIRNNFGLNSSEVAMYREFLEFYNKRGYIIKISIEKCIKIEMKTLNSEFFREIC